jgi:hypothetical protein
VARFTFLNYKNLYGALLPSFSRVYVGHYLKGRKENSNMSWKMIIANHVSTTRAIKENGNAFFLSARIDFKLSGLQT